MTNIKVKLFLYGGAALLLLVVSVVVSLSVGSAGLSLGDVWGILTARATGQEAGGWNAGQQAIVLNIRLPRVLLAILIGACLALAGAGFQGVLRNPLADPFTLGVASGSSIGAAGLILFGWQVLLGLWTIPMVAFATGFGTLLLVLALSRSKGAMIMETLILSGVVVQAFLGSLVSFMMSMSQSTVNQILYWLMGSIALKGWHDIYAVLPFLMICFPILIAFARPLNLFALGERHAAHLGVNVERTKLAVLVVSTMLTAAAVSVAGVVGFVGLVIPHLIRLIAGPDYRLIIPLSAIGGGIFVLWADTLARVALSPREIQLGIVTAFIGAPFFAYLLYKRKAAQGGVS